MKYAMHTVEDNEMGENGIMVYTDVYEYVNPDDMYMSDVEDELNYNDLETAIDLASKNAEAKYADLGLTENCHFVATGEPEKFMKALEKEMILKGHSRLTGE